MKKKIIVLLSLVILTVLSIFLFDRFFKPTRYEGGKEIFITIIIDETQEILFEGSLKTDTETLGELMDEAKELQMETEEASFGRFIISLKGQEQGDIATGPWWLYESENNKVCVQSGYCPGIDELPIQDGDQFKFELKK